MSLETISSTLDDAGFCIIHLFPPSVTSVLNERVNRARMNFIEYNLTEGSEKFAQHVWSPNGLLANPSSFHHTSMRYLRLHCKRALTKILSTWIEEQKMDTNYRLEALFDQLSVRWQYNGETAYRRDVYVPDQDSETLKELLPGDIMLGGWINCNIANTEGAMQKFCCVPGSWRDYKPGERPEVDKDSPLIEQYDTHVITVDVPPGSIVIYRHGLAYRELKTSRSPFGQPFNELGPDLRLRVSHRLTLDAEPLFHDQLKWIEAQAVPRIASGAFPTLYPKKPRSWGELQDWALRMFRDECLEAQANDHKAPERVMKSLSDYQLGMFPSYTPEDIEVMKPTRVLGE